MGSVSGQKSVYFLFTPHLFPEHDRNRAMWVRNILLEKLSVLQCRREQGSEHSLGKQMVQDSPLPQHLTCPAVLWLLQVPLHCCLFGHAPDYTSIFPQVSPVTQLKWPPKITGAPCPSVLASAQALPTPAAAAREGSTLAALGPLPKEGFFWNRSEIKDVLDGTNLYLFTHNKKAMEKDYKTVKSAISAEEQD